ncbi:FkbM family methyltransferase [Streptomyces huasconensis]|nr:FkbM family methyltransferase [Streptomyces huasconensis]
MTVFQQNKSETEFVYDEIFTHLEYLRNGITIDDGDTIVDVGANIGLFTLFAGSRCPDVRVHAFEPIPPVFDSLRRNVALHGIDAKVYDCGLAAEAKEETFTFYRHNTVISSSVTTTEQAHDLVRSYLRNQEELTGGASGEAAADDGLVDELVDARLDSEEFTCRLRPLSEIIAEEAIDRIDLLKIDVENAEYEVLKGIQEHDWPRIRQLVVELHDVDGRLDEVTALLKDHGYDLVCEQGNRLLRNTTLYNVYARRVDDRQPRQASEPAPVARPQRWSGRTALVADVRERLRTALPDYMLPAAYVLLEELPLTQNGKLDRRALPAPVSQGRAYVAPRTPSERQLCDLIAQVLRIERAGLSDNFFELGGDSLLATRLTSRIGKTLGVNVLIREVYEAKDVAHLAHIVQKAPAAKQPQLRRMDRSAPR